MFNIDPQEFRSACQAREIASAYYLNNPRVTLIDVGQKITDDVYTGEVAVRIHLRHKPEQAVFEAFRGMDEGLFIDKSKIPFTVDLIEANYSLDWSWPAPQPADERARIHDPLRGGISISSEWLSGYGTLGGLVEDLDSGEPMILSNWHVLAVSAYAPKGLSVFQPGYGDGGGYDNTIATFERHAMDDDIDAAVAKLTGARQLLNDQLGIGPVSGIGSPALGMNVVKSGRKSAVTHGVIDGVFGEYPINYGGFTSAIRFVQRIVPLPGMDRVSEKGDSGSWWLQEGTRQAVALHFAGFDEPETALAISMPQVFAALRVKILSAAPGIPPEVPAPQAELVFA